MQNDDLSDQEKLTIIRSESMRYLSVIRGYAALIAKIVEADTLAQDTALVDEYVSIIQENTIEIYDLIDSLTS